MKSKAAQKNKKSRSRRDTIGGIIFLALVVIGILIGVLYSNGVFSNLSSGDRKVNMDTGQVVETAADLDPDIKENPNIGYPGYGDLTFLAGKKSQNVYLRNPKENTCYFKMSLILEDGRVIWQSMELEPGCAFDRIELSEALEKGIYENTLLVYEGYSMKDGRKLNGSSINLTINVN